VDIDVAGIICPALVGGGAALRPAPQGAQAAGIGPEPRAPGRGGIENKHSTNVESPPPPPRVCMSGGLLRTSTRPTMNLLLLLRVSV
jgi:hypothetical protein